MELKHLTPYLPYQIKVVYQGILNGKELKEFDEKFKDLDFPDIFNIPNEIRPKEVIGDKVGYIKKVEFWKNGTKYKIGIKSGGLQTHYNTEGFKPILRPLSDLTKEIDFKGIGTTVCVMDMLKKLDPMGDFHLKYDRMSLKDVPTMDYRVIGVLLEGHFDIFGLIEKGEAVDINTVKMLA